MTNLIPEQRLDRNGKLVTKHVRANPKQGMSRSVLPAPTTSPKATGKAAKKPYKPLPRQLESLHRGFRIAGFPANDPLTTQDQRDRNWRIASYTNFNATDAEMYDVLSATTSQGNALEIMATGGVRSAKEARAYLKKHKATELIADRSEVMTEAFERGMSAETFIYGYDYLEEEDRKSPYVLDAIEYKNSMLHKGLNGFVLRNVLDGDVALADLKAIGFSRLKTQARAYSLTEVLTKLNRGEADYTIDEVKAFVIMTAEAKADDKSFNRAVDFALHRGFGLLQDKQEFGFMNQEHYRVLAPTSSFKRDHADEDIERSLDRIEYGVRLSKRITLPTYSGVSAPYFEAGIPLEIAADVVNSGGGIREAVAIHQEGIKSSVASGWL